MRFFVFNSKGGCGKSLVTREVIAAPFGKKITIAEVDELNKTQLAYKDQFNDVIELNKENIKDLLIHLNEHDNIVVDVGADNLTNTLQVMIDYNLFVDIDKVIIPLARGRTDAENALTTYKAIKPYCNCIMFALTMYDPAENLEGQYQVFFNNVKKVVENFTEKNYVTINASNVFVDAQNAKKLVTELAADIDHKSAALAAKKEGDMEKFHDLMRQELNRRSANILMENCIMPAHDKLIG